MAKDKRGKPKVVKAVATAVVNIKKSNGKKPANKKKSKSGVESSRKRTCTSPRRFWLTGGTSLRHIYRKATRKEDGFLSGVSFISSVLYLSDTQPMAVFLWLSGNPRGRTDGVQVFALKMYGRENLFNTLTKFSIGIEYSIFMFRNYRNMNIELNFCTLS